MFSIKDNSIRMAVDSPSRVIFFFIGEDDEIIKETGHIKSGWFNNDLFFISCMGKNPVRITDIKNSIKGWEWAIKTTGEGE